MKNLILSFLLLTLSLVVTNCKKETIILPSPSIKIDSTAIAGLTSFKIRIEIQKGKGQDIKSAKLRLEDITVRNNKPMTYDIDLNSDQDQIITKTINTNRLDHDYMIEAVLETNQYTYTSGKQILRSIKNKYQPRLFVTNKLYAIPEENIALTLNSGTKFTIEVDYENKYVPDTIAVKLNQKYVLESTLNFEHPSSAGDYISSLGSATIPDNVPPGDYSVDLYLDGQHFACPGKIRILKGSWTAYEENYPGEKRGGYAWFVVHDKLYLVGGNYYSTLLQYSPVWEYNLTNKTWVKKSNFPHYTDDFNWALKTEILPYSMQNQDVGYILVRYDQTVELWEYSQTEDLWNKITEYPGVGERYLVAFMLDGYLYVGGGIDDTTTMISHGTKETEFYRCNLTSLQWEKMHDLPSSLNGPYYYSVCTQKNKAYCAEPDRKLWEYDPLTDEWTRKHDFTGPWRMHSKLVSDGTNIYLLGGEYHSMSALGNMTPPLKDSWKYSPNDDHWEQQAFLPAYISRGIAFNYKNEIYTGLGILVETSYEYNNNNQYIYRFSSTNN